MRAFLKTTIGFFLAAAMVSGCSGKKSGVKPSEMTIQTIALGAKTTSGKPVDAYELQISRSPTLILVVGGGKLETSSKTYLLALDGHMLPVDRQMMNNSVLILEKQSLVFRPIPNITPDMAKAKCSAGKIIDLPIDDILKTAPPSTIPMPGKPR